VTLVVLGIVFVGAVFGVRALGELGRQPKATAATSGTNIELSAFPDGYVCHSGGFGLSDGGTNRSWVSYCPSTSIRVPAHSTVTVTIKQYDTGDTVHNSFFSSVWGTVGGEMQLNGSPVARVRPDDVGHTFTIQTPPDRRETQLFVSVPLPGVAENAPNTETIAGHRYPKPNVIVFRFRTGSPGRYVWHCYVPCGTGLAGDGPTGQAGFGGPMATTGYMAGTLTVT